MRMRFTQLLGVAAVLALLASPLSIPVATADPGQDGSACLPFLGCATWNSGSGSGCIDGIGCAHGNLGDLSGCVDGRGCGTYRLRP